MAQFATWCEGLPYLKELCLTNNKQNAKTARWRFFVIRFFDNKPFFISFLQRYIIEKVFILYDLKRILMILVRRFKRVAN